MDKDKVWTLALNDATQGYPYLKRFTFEPSAKPQRFVGNEEESTIILLTDTYCPRFMVEFGGADSERIPAIIDAEEFIAVKGFKAKGKRISTFEVAKITEIEPAKLPPEPEQVENEGSDQVDDVDNNKPETSENLGNLFDLDFS
jgi:topoisomerase-4 subunit A